MGGWGYDAEKTNDKSPGSGGKREKEACPWRKGDSEPNIKGRAMVFQSGAFLVAQW